MKFSPSKRSLVSVHILIVSSLALSLAMTPGQSAQAATQIERPSPLRPLFQAGSPSDIVYIYDPVSRLRAVVDPAAKRRSTTTMLWATSPASSLSAQRRPRWLSTSLAPARLALL